MTTKPSRRLAAAVSVLALGLAGAMSACGSSGGSDAADKADVTTTSELQDAPLTVLVTNDDGYQAAGIDALVRGLRKQPALKVVVYAPMKQQSGTGGKTTDGKVEVKDLKLNSGIPVKAVDGYPADTIRVAMDEDGVKPDLVITGINLGQNIGPLVDLSGTVGAARAAVARGVPALATSSGVPSFDVDAAVPFVIDWFVNHRAEIAARNLAVEVQNLNVPSCEKGKVRGLLDVEVGIDEEAGTALQSQDCTSKAPQASLTDDVKAFNAGFATLSTLSSKPYQPNKG
ncbi:MAG: 5'/3'-nucleotidase SurE [Acidimicrobiales bacterium]|nr:5'/3'-nucleotidase SurE [Acidimicrobiales bacterium]